jgi:DNA helicase-2/ATP-dependent DNA helicase PcrA
MGQNPINTFYMSRQYFEQKFEQELSRLNQAQLQAVKNIEGPILVVAGPGTGKTQILATRIGYILQNTDTQANEILCLTYTEAGTHAMKERLLKFIGETAYQINIGTFHSFCNRVIQENQSYFSKGDMDPISDLEKLELLDEIIAQLPTINPLIRPKTDRSYLRSELSQFFDLMKKENFQRTELNEKIALRRQEHENSDEFRYKRKSGKNQAGDLKVVDVKKSENKLQRLEWALDLYEIYIKKMSAINRYDFADMILWVIDLFQNDADVLQSYQERYQYFLVDEFQDTNGAQNNILHLLCSFWENPNVFVVGDDDQSIFRFQGAEVENIFSFANRYPNLQSVVLTENYRSTQLILDASTALIAHNEHRMVNHLSNLSKNLVASGNHEQNAPIQLLECLNPIHEALKIGEQIIENILNGSEPDSIAVLYSKHAQAEEIAKYLKYKGIKVHLRKDEDIFNHPSIQNLLVALSWVHAELKIPYSGEHLYFQMMHMPHFPLSPIDAAKFSHWMSQHSNYAKWRDVLNAIQQYASHEKWPFSEKQNTQLDAWIKMSESWLTFEKKNSLQSLVEKVIIDLNLYDIVVHEGDVFQLECIKSFFHFLQSETSRDPKMNLDGFLQKLNLLQGHRLGIKKERILYDKEGVNLITLHSSKGLEFDHVYMVGAEEGQWEKKRSKALPVGFSEILPTGDKSADLEELRRLFYVGMTRAENFLQISWSKQNLNGKEESPSQFIDEISLNEPDLVKRQSFAASDESVNQYLRATLGQVHLNENNILNQNLRKEYLKNYKLSVTHLNSYLDCPTKFYFDNVLRVPGAKNKYMSFGIAVHRALEKMFQSHINKTGPLEVHTLIQQYQISLKREIAGFNPGEYNLILEYGQQQLEKYFSDKIDHWNRVDQFKVEERIDDVLIAGVPVKGVLDLIEITGDSISVTDVKTGSPENAKSKLNPPKAGNSDEDSGSARNGGDYWRQIVFYALLLQKSGKFKQQIENLSLDYVELDKDENRFIHHYQATPEDMDLVSKQIADTYQNIQNGIFSPGCGKSDCHWCTLVNAKY